MWLAGAPTCASSLPCWLEFQRVSAASPASASNAPSKDRVPIDPLPDHPALELEQRLLLDLADPLARQPHALGQHLERLRLAVAQAIAAGQHLALALVE